MRAYAVSWMLYWFRAHAGRVAIAAIIALTSVGLSAVSPHVDDCHDAGCMALAVDHDASVHVISAPPVDDTTPPHCLVCHLVRSFRFQAEARIVSTPVADAGTALHVELFAPLLPALVAQLPSRSPPSFPAEA